MNKAYYRVEWAFLENIIGRMGVHRKMIEVVMRRVQSIRINGKTRGRIVPSRGLH